MNDLTKLATTLAVVAAGVILAGIILDFGAGTPGIDQARAGFRG